MGNLKTLSERIVDSAGTGKADPEELSVLDGLTATVTELNVLDGVTATTAELNILDGVTSTASELNILDGVTATAAEINKAADVSSYTVELTATGAVPATAKVIELNHVDTIIAATYTVVPSTLMIIKNTSATGTAAHTVTLTGGTYNGTNTIATLDARDEMLVVYFDSAGRGQVIVNVGTVGLS